MDDAERRARLLDWFAAGHRELPWRRTRDPWAIWLSEVMLQQTRAASVAVYWPRFLARFPTPAALAAAPEEALLAEWAGLGYYARARNLRRAAQQVVERHGGRVPETADAFAALAGVGPYTLGAVLSIAFDRPLPALDGNVIRVLTRWTRQPGDPSRPPLRPALWARARELADGPLPGTLNQALMELGATICTPRAPKCLLCPVADGCDARAAGDPEAYPAKSRKPERSRKRWVAGLVREGDAIWLARRPPAGLLGGLWELPAVCAGEPGALGLLGLVALGEPRRILHTFTHLHWTLDTWRAEGRPAGGAYEEHRLVALSALAAVGLTGPALKALHAWEIEGAPRRRGAGRAGRPGQEARPPAGASADGASEAGSTPAQRGAFGPGSPNAGVN